MLALSVCRERKAVGWVQGDIGEVGKAANEGPHIPAEGSDCLLEIMCRKGSFSAEMRSGLCFCETTQLLRGERPGG